jgi:porphobilinogen synthase
MPQANQPESLETLWVNTGQLSSAMTPTKKEVEMLAGRFPTTRMRRARQFDWSRRLIAETRLSVSDLIWPLFLHEENTAEPVEIPSMPGVSRVSVRGAVEAAGKAIELGIPAIAVFPATAGEKKDANGSEALNPDNLVCRTIRAIKAAHPDLGVICDVALDPYTDHGHDGLVRESDGMILNDETVDVLCKQAVIEANAGCDVIAPSDMMDGRVGAIRKALDSSGLEHVQIMSYAAKYASGFYGPFRDAIGSSTLRGRETAWGYRDKRTYQMDPANSLEALREVAMDIDEGADSVMVKPGIAYLDVLQRVKSTFNVPTFVYQVSGEYAMLMAAIQNGWLDKKVIMETLLAFKRAGADGILTYFAPLAAQLISGN